MSKIIEVNNISKQYRLGEIGTGTLSHDINRKWAKFLGKPDPYLKVGAVNDRSIVSEEEYAWALQDVSFDVDKGDVLGIVGKNGAGKSTLLKILSRITAPTSGQITYNGRIASLLEVGTGFHPELTGRENIYMNGTIMGMTRREIAHKLDEIIDFAGVAKYIDTPVKRYSSGMVVRLGFAVAAHLQSEILVVDEVLAVGDAEFQSKCIGKMSDISSQDGRTILFVSHNMTAVQNLCNKGVFLKDGKVELIGDINTITQHYLKSGVSHSNEVLYGEGNYQGTEQLELLSARVYNPLKKENPILTIDAPLLIEVDVLNHKAKEELLLGLDLLTGREEVVLSTGVNYTLKKGDKTTLQCEIPADLLNDGIFKVRLFFNDKSYNPIFRVNEVFSFEVVDLSQRDGFLNKINGVIRPKLNWTNTSVS